MDGELLYTDCPELDNRIGYLPLPMLDWDRIESIVLSLPPDYHGKTLTVAQATGPGERQEPEADPIVYPCSVWLYCGYSYESRLISESFQTAIPAPSALGRASFCCPLSCGSSFLASRIMVCHSSL